MRSRKIPPKIMHMLCRVASHHDTGIVAGIGNLLVLGGNPSDSQNKPE